MMMKTQLKHLLLCYWRKKDIGYFNKSFVEPEMTPDPHEILTPYQYFKLFITDKMLEETAFETTNTISKVMAKP